MFRPSHYMIRISWQLCTALGFAKLTTSKLVSRNAFSRASNVRFSRSLLQSAGPLPANSGHWVDLLHSPAGMSAILRTPAGSNRRILFSNGSRRMLFLGFDALGMPVFSARSFGA
jgi:hypothetical protein